MGCKGMNIKGAEGLSEEQIKFLKERGAVGKYLIYKNMKESKPLVKVYNEVEKLKLEGYDELLYDIRSLLEKARYYAYKAVDNIRVQTYWQIGERIVREELQHKERADYGKRVVEMLAMDLGFQRRVLYRIVQFYNTHPIVSTLSTQLIEPTTPEKAFKDSYDFDFLALPERYSEKDVENGLLSKTEQLLLEFGTDFALLARQKPIIIDGEYHRVDLELYHRGIPCIILVDLKIGKFKADYVGQMNKYLNY